MDARLELAFVALRDGVRSFLSRNVQPNRVQSVTVIGFVADQSRRERVEEAVPEDPFDKLPFVRRSALDTNGERRL